MPTESYNKPGETYKKKFLLLENRIKNKIDEYSRINDKIGYIVDHVELSEETSKELYEKMYDNDSIIAVLRDVLNDK